MWKCTVTLLLVIKSACVCSGADFIELTGTPLPKTTVYDERIHRFTTKLTKKRFNFGESTYPVSFEEPCDHIAYECMAVYDTGRICGRNWGYTYMTFDNYCALDYVNCMEKYEEWQIAYMGKCFRVQLVDEYKGIRYDDDSFLDRYYI